MLSRSTEKLEGWGTSFLREIKQSNKGGPRFMILGFKSTELPLTILVNNKEVFFCQIVRRPTWTLW